jgi:hypothetical protein
MDQDLKPREGEESINEEAELVDRRRFLIGLGKWSMAIIGGVVAGGALLSQDREATAGWVNRGGGGAGWVNRGGGAGWVNGGGGGAWANRIGGGGAWANRGAGWINRGGSWVNRF